MENNLALIIEDDVDLSNIFAEALRAAGFETEIIRDGAVAQQRLKEVAPYIVILDMHLPHVDGSVLLSQIRTDPPLQKVKVVIVTADAIMGDMYREQAELTFVKPVTFTQLRDFTERMRLQK